MQRILCLCLLMCAVGVSCGEKLTPLNPEQKTDFFQRLESVVEIVQLEESLSLPDVIDPTPPPTEEKPEPRPEPKPETATETPKPVETTPVTPVVAEPPLSATISTKTGSFLFPRTETASPTLATKVDTPESKESAIAKMFRERCSIREIAQGRGIFDILNYLNKAAADSLIHQTTIDGDDCPVRFQIRTQVKTSADVTQGSRVVVIVVNEVKSIQFQVKDSKNEFQKLNPIESLNFEAQSNGTSTRDGSVTQSLEVNLNMTGALTMAGKPQTEFRYEGKGIAKEPSHEFRWNVNVELSSRDYKAHLQLIALPPTDKVTVTKYEGTLNSVPMDEEEIKNIIQKSLPTNTESPGSKL